MRPSDGLIVSATEPTGKDRKKVWMQNINGNEKIHIKNSNDVYEEFVNSKNIENIKQYDYTLSCGLVLHFLKYGKMVVCVAEGIINNLVADTNQTINIAEELKPFFAVRNAFVLDETGILAYIYLQTNCTLEFRVKTTISSNRFPRFSFCYIANK